MKVTDRASLSAARLAEIQNELETLHTLQDVLTWGFKQPVGTVNSQIIADVVIQDEFNHDVIVPWKDGLVIVYGTT
jgi:hypothetical protein